MRKLYLHIIGVVGSNTRGRIACFLIILILQAAPVSISSGVYAGNGDAGVSWVFISSISAHRNTAKSNKSDRVTFAWRGATSGARSLRIIGMALENSS